MEQQQANGRGLAFDRIFVVTYGRTGSTLLQGLLNGIEGVHLKGENMGFATGLFEAWRRLHEAVAIGGRGSDAPTDPWFGTREIDLDGALEDLRAAVDRVLWAGCPSPETVTCLGFKEIRHTELEEDLAPYLDFLKALYPQAGFVFLTRDVEEVLRSGWWAGMDPSTARRAIEGFERRAAEYAHARADCHAITYRDMVDRTPALAAMYAFLGAPYDPEAVAATLGVPHSYQTGRRSRPRPAPGAARPRFVLGLGAQKAASSWLNEQMSRADGITMPFKKELGVWAYRYLYKDPFRESLDAKLSGRMAGTMRAMRREPGAYEAYFHDLVAQGAQVTGDITPAYCALGADHLTEIRARMEAAGFDMRAAFVLRDPARRVWSALQMMRRNGNIRFDLESEKARAKALGNFMRRPHTEVRTLYPWTLGNLRAALPEEAVFTAVYEEMFDPAFVDRLSAFLGVPLPGIDLSERVNHHGGPQMTRAEYDLCRAHYAEVYDWCAEAYPQTRRLWRFDAD